MITYHARFTGRSKGAIGIFHACECFIAGENEAAARLNLYNDYEHIQGLSLTPLVVRYVATCVNLDGVRTLVQAAQGRYTYATPAECQAWIDAIKASNDPEWLRQPFGRPAEWEVRPVDCWPGHFDPVRIYFD